MPGLSETRTYDALLTTTLANYSQKLRDNIFDEYPLLSWLNGKLADALQRERVKRTLDGGESITEPIIYEKSTSGGAYAGREQLVIVPQEGITQARYAWRQYAWTIEISGLERRSNQGEAKMIDLLKAKTTQAEQSMRDTMNIDAYGSNSGGKSLDGLGVIVDSTGTCGSLPQSSYAWWAATERAGGSFAAQGQNDMRIVFNTLTWGNNSPDGIFTTQSIYEFFENSVESQIRYTNTKAANVGFQNLTFKGVPVFFDRDCTAGVIFFLNSRALKFAVHKDADFATGKFIEPENQDVMTAKILFQGNLTTGERRKHGKITGVTA